MVVSGTKWGWKRIAARLLLVPVLAGGGAGTAHAQNSKMPAKAPAGAAAGDPQALLKEGRKALADGRYDDAQDLARKAEANNPGGKWGLFDDTPSGLIKDVQAAAGKANKAQAEQLVKQAKAMAARPAKSDAEKAQNLDAALQMARRADTLHGPYSVWDLGDRPDKMAKEYEAARAKLKVPPPTYTATLPGPSGVRPAAGTNMPGGPSNVAPAGGAMATRTPPPLPPRPTGPLPPAAPAATAAAADPAKAAAVQLMADGKLAADRGDFAAAKAKYTEAARTGARFTDREPNPGFALQELNARGASAVDRLIKESQARAANKDYARAEAALNSAAEIAAALNLFARPIEQAKSDLRVASNGQFGGAAPGGLAPAGGPEALVHVGPATPAPTMPAMPAAPVAAAPMVPMAPAVAPMTTPAVAAAPAPVVGNELLTQAAVELKRGDLELARRLALQAHNQGAQAEAKALLTQIDAEVFAAKQRAATRAFEAAVAAAKDKNHSHAFAVLLQIDPKMLPADQSARRDELIALCKAELDKPAAVTTAGGVQLPAAPAEPASPTNPMTAPAGTAAVGEARPASPDSAATQADAMRRVAFQKYRAEGLKVQSDAQAAFGRGETDVAITMLADYANRVRAAGLPGADAAMLLRPVDSRMEMFRVMKGQTDALAREKKEKADARELVTGKAAADEARKAEVRKLVGEFQRLVQAKEFDKAERVALQAKQLDPDDPAIGALAHMAKMRHRVKMVEDQKDQKERMVFGGLHEAGNQGPLLTPDNPVAIRLEAYDRARRRGGLDDFHIRTRSTREMEIELKLDRPVSVEFDQMPLGQAVEELREKTGLPLDWDDANLDSPSVKALPVSAKLNGYSARNALYLLLSKAKLNFVIEYEAVRITSETRAKGRLFTKVFSVADLVTPVPNFAIPEYANFEKMLKSNGVANGNVQIAGLTGPGSLAPNGGGLGGGTPLAGANLGTAPVATSGGVPFTGGTLSGTPAATAPTTTAGTMAADNPKKHEHLVRLITGMVRPFSWDGPHNGPGKIEYFDLGSALVVNQTADVIREVTDLLEALRRLQDLAVAVEVRIISLSETWFERMGVDFAMNVKTNSTKFEPQLTSRQFRPEPFLNDINARGVTVGLQPAGAGSGAGINPAFTPDLDVPFKSTSFNYAIPGFGGYPNNPGFNGGVSLGLAFLNDIQVYLFMEAAQGDRRVNVMQAPKLTLFNGQTATITVTDLQFFVTNVTVVGVNGQIIFVPNNTPLPGPGAGGLTVALQAVVSADRRFVRINIPVTISAQTGATVPLFPVTTFIIPVFEGGSQGQPVPFTQFLQQPSFTTMTIATTVVCPDGGTVLLGGLKTLSEGRNEFGPPFLSKIPYLNRLFKNVGIGRETTHIMIMVTPRIIINAEEEITQTEGGGFGARPVGQ